MPRRFGRKTHDKPADAPRDVSQLEAEPILTSPPGNQDQQRLGTDTEGLADRWRASHEEWRQKLRAERC